MVKIAEFTYIFTILFLVLFFGTQLVWPLAANKPPFPILRHKKTAALDELAEAREEKEINAIKEAADQLRNDDATKRRK